MNTNLLSLYEEAQAIRKDKSLTPYKLNEDTLASLNINHEFNVINIKPGLSEFTILICKENDIYDLHLLKFGQDSIKVEFYDENDDEAYQKIRYDDSRYFQSSLVTSIIAKISLPNPKISNSLGRNRNATASMASSPSNF